MVMTPTRRSCGVDHGGCDQIVFAEHPRDLFLVVLDQDAAAVFLDQLGKRHRTARAQQHVERDRAPPALVGIDHVDLVEPVRQIGRLAHVVDGLADGPMRRHGDDVGLHPPAGGAFRIVEAALDLLALGGRQLFEDLLLVLLVEAFEQFDGVVGFELANALGDRLGLELLEDFLADGVVDLVQRGEVEIRAGQLHEADAVLGVEGRDQVAEIGLVQFGHDLAQERSVRRLDAAGDLLDEFGANFAVFVAHRQPVEHRGVVRGKVLRFGHGRLAGLTEGL